MNTDTKPRLSLEEAKEIFAYDPLTGVVSWKERPASHFDSISEQSRWNTRLAGKAAGSLKSDKRGGMVVTVYGVVYRLHRLAWLLSNGEWPALTIDHRDGDPTNNKLENLRLASGAEQQRNTGLSCRNKSGVRGVHWRPATQRWCVQIMKDGKQNFIGTFIHLEDAKEARRAAEIEFHGEFSSMLSRSMP